MKKILSLLISSALMLSLVACSTETASAEQTLTGEDANGFGGNLSVTLTVKDGVITELSSEHAETPTIGGVAIDNLIAEILETQNVNPDVVAGATVTTDAFLAALNAALATGGLSAEDFAAASSETGEKTAETKEVDLVIVGAGGAGITAAIEATQAGKSVLVLEKMPFAGGNTVRATGGMNAAETSVQAELEIEDSIQTFIDDTYTGGYEVGNLDLITTMAENSAEAIDWLAEIGAPLPEVSFSGGATNKRIHRPEGGAGVGDYLVTNLMEVVEELNIEILYNTTATEVVMTEGAATGVLASSNDTDYTVNAKAVILATGGFGANSELFTEYRPDLEGFVTTNHSGALGEGIVMAQAVGASLTDIEQVQIHPTVHQESTIMITESVRGGGAILVNQTGDRFINELDTRDVVSAAILEQEGGYAYLVFDQQVRDGLSAIEKYVDNGLTYEAQTIEELAALIGADAANLSASVESWNTAVDTQVDEAFGRTTGMDVKAEVAPYYAIQIAPGVHHTMGGVTINTSAEVISTEGDVIPGLYAAGEVTGGIHGGNRIGGNAVTDIIVFGRIAAASANEYIG